MGRLPASQKHRPHRKRWKRYEKAKPGHRLQKDVKFLERIPGTGKRLYQFTAIDDCARIRVLKVYDRCNQRTAIRFLNEVRKRLPFRIMVLQTDDGAEFQSRFHWHAESLDIKHVYIRPASPNLNGKVERSHRIDEQEFYQVIDQNGSRMISTCSTRNCVNGRTTKTIIVLTGHCRVGPRMNDWSKNRELSCHRGLETLH
jgi:transposase InsO family protein